jgi:hypothetical protein
MTCASHMLFKNAHVSISYTNECILFLQTKLDEQFLFEVEEIFILNHGQKTS